MKKEIHRMELREAQLKKAQEHLLQELKQVTYIWRPITSAFPDICVILDSFICSRLR